MKPGGVSQEGRLPANGARLEVGGLKGLVNWSHRPRTPAGSAPAGPGGGGRGAGGRIVRILLGSSADRGGAGSGWGGAGARAGGLPSADEVAMASS
jgi:hypothetical protein